MEISKKSENDHSVKYANTASLFEKKQLDVSETKHGLLHNEFLSLLCQKLGIMKTELNTINKKSLTFIRSMAAKYARLSKESHVDIEEIKLHLSGYPDFQNRNRPGNSLPGESTAVFFKAGRYGYGTVQAEGGGTASLADGWGDDRHYDHTYVGFDYKLRVPVDGFYKISALIIAAGHYFLVADDGTSNSKEASCEVRVGDVNS